MLNQCIGYYIEPWSIEDLQVEARPPSESVVVPFFKQHNTVE